MSSHLSNLVLMQQLDLKIVKLRDRMEQIPREIETLNQNFEEQSKSVDELQGRIEEGGKLRRELEGEVEILREKLSKYKSQLMEVKTNKEYQAMLHEIDSTNREIGQKEDKVLRQMIALDEWEEKAQESRRNLAKSQQEVSKRRSDLEEQGSQTQKDIELCEQERIQLIKQIPQQLTEQYERIASVRNGIALAQARDQSCQACHVKLRPQLFNDIKTHKQITICESCNRILYYAGA